jgi:hypothetical protein
VSSSICSDVLTLPQRRRAIEALARLRGERGEVIAAAVHRDGPERSTPAATDVG